jgi:hypothetical protein
VRLDLQLQQRDQRDAIGSVWELSASVGTHGSSVSPVAFTALPVGGAPIPNWNVQTNGTGPVVSGCCSGGATQVISPGSFSVSVGGTVVGSDSAMSTASVYTTQAGTITGSGISSGWVNYKTGAYSITFNSTPASGAAINASWTNIVSSDWLSLPENIDNVGCCNNVQSGMWASAYDKYPGGVSAHIFGGGPSDYDPIGSLPAPGYPQWAIGYTQTLAWFYNVRLPAEFSAQQPAPILVATNWRLSGAPTGNFIPTPSMIGSTGIDQWVHDSTTPSLFTGYVTAGSPATLTLTSAATGPMWEGEVVGCNPYSTSCALPVGTYIVALQSGTWGANSSVYTLGSPTSTTISNYGTSGSPVAMLNEVAFKNTPANQGEPAYFVGPFLDVAMQSFSSHPTLGFTGGRRIGTRIGVEGAAYLSGGASQTTAVPPTVSRATVAACDAAATAAPCFDVGATYEASASLTWTGSTFTCTGCLAANARNIADGMAMLSCSGCNTGLYVVSVSDPPTQSTTAGQGQIGTTFTITMNGAIGGSGSGTVTFGCSGTSGTGSNCIDVAIKVNTGGTYGGAAKGIANCGVNNVQGTFISFTAPLDYAPNGKCVDPGIGEIVRDFRIGTAQWMGAGCAVGATCEGSVFDDGFDPISYSMRQSSAFTCNHVANTSGIGIVQCVKGPAYTSGVPSAIGEWLTGSTYVSYGDLQVGVGRASSLLGYPGGQSPPFTAGSGYTNGGPYVGTAVVGSCPAGFGTTEMPTVDVWVSGGAIVDVYPAEPGEGLSSTCAFPAISNTNYSGIGSGSSGAITTLPNSPAEGLTGVATYATDSNLFGLVLYDNSGEPSNPLASYYAAPATGTYFEPGNVMTPFGQFYGAAVSG